MLERKTMSLRKLGGDRATEVRFGRFLRNESVTNQELIQIMVEKSEENTRGEHILAIQDTTEINHQSHAFRVSGLGTVGNGTDAGFFLHPMLLVEATGGACLGVGAVHYWNRTKKKSPEYRKQRIEDKESYRWIETAESTKKALPLAKTVTFIADRESDIYEEWYRIPDEKTHLLTRANIDRRTSKGPLLFSFVKQFEVAGIDEIEVSSRISKQKGKRTKHHAKLEIRYGTVEILRPMICSDTKAPKKIELNVVDVQESLETVIPGEDPIHWCLLTTHQVDSLLKAKQIIRWYCSRWEIEQLFRVLKQQGFEVESSQLTTSEGLIKLTLIALRAAIQTLQLTIGRNGELRRPAKDAFEEDEIEFMEKLQPSLEGKTEKQKNPEPKGSLSWAAWIIARLGGWKGYASERPPGPITMITGQKEFASMFRGWRFYRDVCIH